MKIRLFDVIGVLTVTAWVTVVSAYTYRINFDPETTESPVNGVVIKEGESWMLLNRDDAEVGVVHETRTPIEDGWLLEYEFRLNISSMGAEQLLTTEIRATVSPDAILQKFSGRVQSAMAVFDVRGRVEGDEVILDYTINSIRQERRIKVGKPPRLANSVFNQLAAERDSLKPGAIFEQEYFDPMTMGMTTMRFEFVREHDLDVYDKRVHAYHFRQKLANMELDVYVDERGEVQIQELPLRIVAARVPSELGRLRFKTLKSVKKANKGKKPNDLSVDEAVSLLRTSGSLSSNTVFELTEIPEELQMVLDSGAQKAVFRGSDKATVDTSEVGALGLIAEKQHAALQQVPEENLELVAPFLPKKDLKSAARHAEESARLIRKALEYSPAAQRRDLAEAIKLKSGDSEALARLLTQVLRAQKISTRYVLGVVFKGENYKPHYWVQYWTERGFVDLDVTRTTLMPGNSQLQINVDAEFDRDLFEAQLEWLTIKRKASDSALESDFN